MTVTTTSGPTSESTTMTSTGPITFHDDSTAVPETLDYAGVFKRAVALVIDGTITFFGFGYAVAASTGGTTDGGFQLDGGPAFLLFALVALYWIVLEATIGATVGKLLLGMRVRRIGAESVGIGAALARNVLRIVDGLFLYLVGAILVWTSDSNQRLGDRVANTVVVNR